MKKLQITQEDAIRLYPTASKELKEIFESTFNKSIFKKKIYERVTNIKELCNELDIDEDDLFIFDRNTTDKTEKLINATRVLLAVAGCYNEGTVLDWKNSNQYKYFQYKYLSHGAWLVYSFSWYPLHCYPGGLYYKERILSEKAYENFKEFFEDFWG